MKLTPAARENMANVARARSRTWEIMTQLFSAPTILLASNLQDGTLAQQMRGATAWAVPNQGNTTLGDVYRSLRSYSDRNIDTPPEVLLVELRAGFATVLALESPELDHMLTKLQGKAPSQQANQGSSSVLLNEIDASTPTVQADNASDDTLDKSESNTGSTGQSLALLAVAMEEQRKLCLEEASLWESEQLEAAGQSRALQHRRLEAEIVPIWPIVCDLLRENLQSPIYQVIGWLGLCLLTLESGRGYIQS